MMDEWDFRCTCCDWIGTVDEAYYSEEYDCMVCPECGDNELEMNTELEEDGDLL
jgi:Zn finger protein HypA/HybF involved in hydrogenase expression